MVPIRLFNFLQVVLNDGILIICKGGGQDTDIYVLKNEMIIDYEQISFSHLG